MARGIEMGNDRYAWLLCELADFTAQQARTAEAWILRGDWTFKGVNATIALNDFFPNQQQIESLRTPEHRLITREELIKICQIYREEGRSEEREANKRLQSAPPIPKNTAVEARPAAIASSPDEVTALRHILASARREHAALALVGFVEIGDFEQWYAAVNDAIIGIARSERKRQEFLQILAGNEPAVEGGGNGAV